MNITDKRIDNGNPFDWGRTSEDYAKFRDIYPPAFYQNVADRGLCIQGQNVLDLGTGTGVLPRNMYHFGAAWTGIDIAENQILQAKRLAGAAGMDIRFEAVSTEEADFPDASFDVITACQCFWYFDHEKVIPKLSRMLRPGGKLVILYMAWLPYEDEIAGASEQLVLQYNPDWTGAGETRHPIWIPEITDVYFDRIEHTEYDLRVPFTRESWNGRMKACRGVGASLSEEQIAAWEAEHKALLSRIAPETFEILHYAAIAVLQKKS